MQDTPLISTPEEPMTPPLEPVEKQPTVSMTPPSTLPNTEKKKSSSLALILLLALLALGGIGFGLYAWFFRPADTLYGGATPCPKYPECAENEDGYTLHVDDNVDGEGYGYTIRIEEDNGIRIRQYTMGSAIDFESETVGDDVYAIPDNRTGLIYAIQLMSNERNGVYPSEINNMLRTLVDLTDEQLKKVAEYTAEIVQ